ncbi:MAG: membrane protein FxsA [Candidatus Omnitrophica bacterium]|nr:membrane protein FxsA [Candidatus Omnitrophota bacterium]
MFYYLLLLFTLLPACELFLLIKIGSHIGAATTILIIILTGLLGAYLARLQGFLVLRNIQNDLNQGRIPSEELMDGVMILIGGIVLLTPGFITDTFGFILLMPPSRLIIKSLLKRKFHSMIQNGQIHSNIHFGQQRTNGYDDIDL